LNLLRLDFKYPMDFGFREKCRIPSDSDLDLESVTSLAEIKLFQMDVDEGWNNINMILFHM